MVHRKYVQCNGPLRAHNSPSSEGVLEWQATEFVAMPGSYPLDPIFYPHHFYKYQPCNGCWRKAHVFRCPDASCNDVPDKQEHVLFCSDCIPTHVHSFHSKGATHPVNGDYEEINTTGEDEDSVPMVMPTLYPPMFYKFTCCARCGVTKYAFQCPYAHETCLQGMHTYACKEGNMYCDECIPLHASSEHSEEAVVSQADEEVDEYEEMKGDSPLSAMVDRMTADVSAMKLSANDQDSFTLHVDGANLDDGTCVEDEIFMFPMFSVRVIYKTGRPYQYIRNRVIQFAEEIVKENHAMCNESRDITLADVGVPPNNQLPARASVCTGCGCEAVPEYRCSVVKCMASHVYCGTCIVEHDNFVHKKRVHLFERLVVREDPFWPEMSLPALPDGQNYFFCDNCGLLAKPTYRCGVDSCAGGIACCGPCAVEHEWAKHKSAREPFPKRLVFTARSLLPIDVPVVVVESVSKITYEMDEQLSMGNPMLRSDGKKNKLFIVPVHNEETNEFELQPMKVEYEAGIPRHVVRDAAVDTAFEVVQSKWAKSANVRRATSPLAAKRPRTEFHP